MRENLAALLCIVFVVPALADTSVSYEHENQHPRSGDITLFNSPKSDSIQNAIYTLTAEDFATNTALKSQATVRIDINDRTCPELTCWKSSQATATATSTFSEVGSVANYGGVGEMLFTWDVTGSHQLTLDTTDDRGNGVNVIEHSAFAELSYNSGLLPAATVFTEQRNYAETAAVSTGEQFEQTWPAETGSLQIYVPWEGLQDIPIEFQLISQVFTHVESNVERYRGRFQSVAAADFSNTATLTGVFIVDENREVVPGASFISNSGFNYTEELDSIVPPEIESGDFDNSGLLDFGDIDLLGEAIREGSVDLKFDVDDDGEVSISDRQYWVHELRQTCNGDANLDGEFSSSDLVSLFQAGEFEDNVPGNSTWATGDFNGDGEFDSGDFVMAFQAGCYELGPRPAVEASDSTSLVTVPEPTSSLLLGPYPTVDAGNASSVAAVPEPTSSLLLLLGMGMLGHAQRKRQA